MKIERDIFLYTFLSDEFGKYNKKVMRKWGMDVAVFLSFIMEEHKTFKTQNRLKDKYFYCTSKNIYENTGLKRHRQEMALKILKDAKVIKIKKQGLPSKLWFKINFDIILYKVFKRKDVIK